MEGVPFVRIQVDSEPDESVRGCVAIAQSVSHPGRGLLLFFALYGAVLLSAYSLTPRTPVQTVFIAFGAIFSTYYIVRLEGLSRLRRLTRRDPHANETTFIELTAHGVHTWCEHIDARYPWTDFARVSENAEFFLFARSSGSGTVTPKRVVTGPLELELRQCVAEWWGEIQRLPRWC